MTFCEISFGFSGRYCVVNSVVFVNCLVFRNRVANEGINCRGANRTWFDPGALRGDSEGQVAAK